MIEIREHGTEGPLVIALHGGPGAPGTIRPVAEVLGRDFRVLEPLQRSSGEEPLTVATHIADLHEVILDQWGDGPPALVGSSWGAMLALAYAAEYPDRAGPIALVGCGTFDTVARARLQEIIRERMSAENRRRLEGLGEEFPDPDERMKVLGELILPLFSFDPIPDDGPKDPFDAKGNVETWSDMVRLQVEGVYPQAFTAITSPVIMLHGGYDPHPGTMIRKSLEPVIPQLECREWEQCGHDPWIEKHVRDEFFETLRGWLAEKLS